MDVLGLSTLLVALAELGDKTQWLALLLVSRYRRPWLITAALVVAMGLNHALAAWLGQALGAQVPAHWLNWLTAALFMAMGVFTWLTPQSAEQPASQALAGSRVFLGAAVAFFIAEMGDKTQLATATLAANYQQVLLVVIGTTAGMVLANAPVIFLGEKIMQRVNADKLKPWIAAGFVATGLYLLVR